MCKTLSFFENLQFWPSGGPFWAAWRPLGRLGRFRAPPGPLLGRSWGCPGGSWNRLGALVGPSWVRLSKWILDGSKIDSNFDRCVAYIFDWFLERFSLMLGVFWGPWTLKNELSEVLFFMTSHFSDQIRFWSVF